MSVHEPKDKNNGVWLIFFMLGLGTLLPWNFFMTATMYFTSRLRDPSQMGTNLSGNGTGGEGDNRSLLEAKFNNVMTLCAMVPLLAFTCLNSVLHQRIPQKFRIMGSLAVILVVFLLTAILVKIEMAPLPFFTLTMIKIVIINSFGAILQGSLFGMAGKLPTKYTTPIMSGQGLAGTFAAFSMICAIASGSEINDAAFGYFITACAVILLAIISYVVLPKLEFYQYYKTQSGNRVSDEENKLELLKKENAAETRPVFNKGEEEQNVSMLTIFKKIWVLALSVCFAFTITIGTFPAVTVDVKSTIADGGTWELYFIPVCCFLLFNLSDWVGRSLTAVCMWPGEDSKLVPILLVARVIFVPLFMLCNVQPRYNLPIFFEHDAWFIVFMIVFAFSNGYLASLCMCFGPKKVAVHEAETAGAIMAFFLSLGLALGASLSFLFRGLV
ncbi:equilibrative nucleoside transporter 1 [Salmo trutta]|uniref:Solute carrier family 29 member 1 (Augustine blood group) n=1 Tax=Salmo trutta TaxID=8032 RepID=A0A674C1V0_SALTR|nr:equilibrative nucleoside transporter 1-like [Salmo trutta]XP_029632364.1 equilibrative nucleoside transporter 1-like [Salmo trutta]XP_029632365.1 equilibrative nucleoside transporter 1-like [Salmo trutta]XP_029632366.1 equilibrative nucleoside transporter 1-like [Salmo trutta]XP_029632367.1 equilibrative nucleoside transporter 1-like [Salmo trutta]XP_029632368.1 equilibrative nucleoside transporter 1-like [Salmo trutta]XP_029632369.1 equilibrative nucleoside transporter 1-like [Salmo trutt